MQQRERAGLSCVHTKSALKRTGSRSMLKETKSQGFQKNNIAQEARKA